MAATEAMIWVLLKSDGSIEMPYAQEIQGWCARHGKEVKIELLDLGTDAGGAGVVSAVEKLRREEYAFTVRVNGVDYRTVMKPEGYAVVHAVVKRAVEASVPKVVDEFSEPGAYRAGFTYDTQTPEDVEALKFPCQTCGMQPLVRERFVNGLGAAIVEHKCAKCGKVLMLDEFVQGGPGRILHVDGKPVCVPDAPYHTLPFGAVGQPPPKPPTLRDMLELHEAADNVYRRLTATVTACDCGAEKTGTTHADYCSTRKP